MAYVAPAGNALNYYALGTYLAPAGDKLLFDGKPPIDLPAGSLRGLVRCPFGRQENRSFSRRGAWRAAGQKRAGYCFPWTSVGGTDEALGLSWDRPAVLDGAASMSWAVPPALETFKPSGWQYGRPLDGSRNEPWQQAGILNRAADVGYAKAMARDQARVLGFVDVLWLDLLHGSGWEIPEVVDAVNEIVWGREYIPRYCWRLERRVYGDALFWNGTASYTPPAGDALLFTDSSAGWPIRCVGGVQTGPKDAYWYRPRRWVIPRPFLRRSYLMVNTVSLKIISSNYDIAIDSMEISADRDAWCWSLSAGVLQASDLALLRPINGIPIAVEATINGFRWRFFIEEFGATEKFGGSVGTVRGRSLSAALAAPYASGITAPCGAGTSRQLAEAELANTSWTTVWTAPDWLVPAGAMTWQNQTPMAIVTRIAEAGGACVQSHPWDTVLAVAPWWSTLPWQWGGMIVDAIIPPAMIEQKPWALERRGDFNGVWVRGESIGVNALIRRAGTDGSKTAPDVVDALLTDITPATGRGARILADNLTRERNTLPLPLMENPGLLTPGKVVEIQESTPWRGMVARCVVSVRRPAVWQSIEVLKVG
jgi:hypothetical protein